MSIGPDDWKRLQELHALAQSRDPSEWEELVERAFPDREDLRKEARAMLKHAPPTDFMAPVDVRLEFDQIFGGGLEGHSVGGFELVRELGRGGMGVVYLALQAELDRTVALKVLPLSRAGDGRSLERFRREAKTASQMDHPGIAQILSFGETESMAWYAMRYVSGHDLAKEIRLQAERRKGNNSATLLWPQFDSAHYVPKVVRCLADLAGALDYAHVGGVVHRDVKPPNILLDDQGLTHLVDFGLAKDERFGSLTETGALQGTPFYMSPEQARAGEQRVDHRTDIYSLCVVLYEALSLVRPFAAKTGQDVIQKIVRTEPVPVSRHNPRVPRDLEVICAKGMSKAVDDRYSSAMELREDLERFLAHEAIHARPLSVRQRLIRRSRRHRRALLFAGVLLLAILVGAWVATGLQRKRHHQQVASALVDLNTMPDWSQAHDDLSKARELIASQPGFGAKTSGLHYTLRTAFERRLERFRTSEQQRGEETFTRGLEGELRSSTPQGPRTAPSLQRMQDGLQILSRLARLFPEDKTLQEQASIERTLPQVRCDVRFVDRSGVERVLAPNEFQIFVAPFDPFTDGVEDFAQVGHSNGGPFSLAVGWWCIEVRVEGHGIARHLREIGLRSEPLIILSRVHPSEFLRASMIGYEGGQFVPRDPVPLGCFTEPGGVAVRPFHLDRFEVSNADFARYLEESGANPPHAWAALGYRTSWTEMALAEFTDTWPHLPATMIPFEQARAFAEWHGKRLPLHSELDFAIAELPESLLQPQEPSAGGSGFANAWKPKPDFNRRPGQQGAYLTSFEPLVSTRDPRFRQGPRGIAHLFGNAREWTASPSEEIREGRRTTFPATYLCLGAAYQIYLGTNAPTQHVRATSSKNHADWHIGWRCAY